MTRTHHTVEEEQQDTVSLSVSNWIGLVTVLVLLVSPFIFLLWNHEVRITQREASSFTSQDANKLTLSIAELTITVANLTTEVLEQKSDIKSLEKEISNLKMSISR